MRIETGQEYEVWCGNVMASKEIVDLIRIYNLGGVSFRPADFFLFPFISFSMRC